MQPYRISLTLNFLLIIHFSHANWGTPGSGQYHIQTDEGPERFFKYQTDNGQYRKERRLLDGTVIGTNAWIDGLGYLRMSEYIADHAGYRIMNSKTVFVGKDRPIEEAMKMAKSSETSTRRPATVYVPVKTTTSRPLTSAIPYSTPGYYHNKNPSVVILPHSQPRDDYNPNSNFNDLNHSVISYPTNDLSHVQKPSIYYEPPLEDVQNNRGNSLPSVIIIPTSTPSTIENESHLPPIVIHPSSTPSSIDHHTNDVNDIKDESDLPPLAYYPSSTVKPLVKDESHLPPIAFYPSSTERPLDFNNVIPLSSTPAPQLISNELLPPKDSDNSYDRVVPITARPNIRYRPSSYRHESSTERTIVDYDRNVIDAAASYIAPTYQNNPNNVPLFDRRKYQQQQQNYDGVGVTANGFRYFLPRQYQEEVDNKGEDSRDGSYGYIDPFGIRRVVYYNAGKNGFVHRKNNRYVGFNSTPYDPRPN